MHTVARLALHPHIPNIQASWVKMGPERAAQLLAGARAGWPAPVVCQVRVVAMGRVLQGGRPWHGCCVALSNVPLHVPPRVLPQLAATTWAAC